LGEDENGDKGDELMVVCLCGKKDAGREEIRICWIRECDERCKTWGFGGVMEMMMISRLSLDSRLTSTRSMSSRPRRRRDDLGMDKGRNLPSFISSLTGEPSWDDGFATRTIPGMR